MSQRTRLRGGSDDGVQPDRQVAAAASAIAGLRRLLRPLSTIDTPVLLRELGKLDELIMSRSGQGRTGRHRSPGGRKPARRDRDGDGELMPDPAAARTPAEFITVLWQYKAWRGNPTWRTMAADAGQIVVHSTIYKAMHGHALPTLDVVKAIVLGCRGSQDDLDAFTSAWHRVNQGTRSSQGDDPGLLPAPVPALPRFHTFLPGESERVYNGHSTLSAAQR